MTGNRMIFADIIVDISHERLDRTFQYAVPEELEPQIRVGMVVTLPFGRGDRRRKGYVVALSDRPRFDAGRIKTIYGLSSDEETTESRMIALAAWMKEHYGSTMIQALKTVFPVQDKVRAREKRRVCLNVTREEGEKAVRMLEAGRSRARARILRALLEEEQIDYTRAASEFKATPAVLNPLIEQGLIRIQREEAVLQETDAETFPADQDQELTQDQRSAVAEIREEWKRPSPRPVLLCGVTGSGKTRVYMEMIEEILAQGGQAIVLIPEIALTYQTVRRFYARFGSRVSVLNSRLSQGERYQRFKMAKEGRLQVMVGPRSALFTPFSDLRLIIIDEEHEPTYKSENSPRYHARETAVVRAGMEGARVILGSATPSLEAYSRAMSGEYALVKLSARYGSRSMPQVTVVDMRQELREGNRSVLSRRLQNAVEERLRRGEQTMLFLNRRGYAGFVACRSCGHVMKCPHCDVSMSEHSNGRLICHYCGYEEPKAERCPECGSAYIGGFKAGTQQIEQVVRKVFPTAGILRMDYDTTRGKGSYEKILSAFARHEADILIGTQMIVKGHDFPDVTLVGVVAADLSLNAADYRCGERTFQLLTQAAGRSGRGSRAGEAVIQTYHPEHYSIQASAKQDYEAFYREEMGYRALMDYPPAGHMMEILASCGEEMLLEQAMEYLARFIRRVSPGEELHVIGPAYETVGKINDIYRKVIYLKHRDAKVLTSVRDKVERYIEINSGFRKIYIQFDLS